MLVTEYMSNGDLQNFLSHASSSSFSWKQKLRCALDVSEGLVYLHSWDPKIIHRDLKPANVLLNGELRAKIADFGISREMDESTMTVGMGTYRWMAPEVLTSGHYSESADIFSLGAILSELDTHKTPYSDLVNTNGKSLTDAAILSKVMNGGIRPTFTAACPRVVLDLAADCLSFDPEERPLAVEVSFRLRTALKEFMN